MNKITIIIHQIIKSNVLLFVLFLTSFYFRYRSKDFDVKGSKRFVLAVRLAIIVTTFAIVIVITAHAKDSQFFRGANAFSQNAPILLPSRSHQEHFSIGGGSISKMQVEIAKSIKNLPSKPGFVGYRKDTGYVLINKKTRQVHFIDGRTNRWPTSVIKSPSELKPLIKNGYHLFPTAGKP